MTRHNSFISRLTSTLLSAALALGCVVAVSAPTVALTGCQKKKKAKVEEPPPPPPPPAPERITLDPILQEMQPSAKVQWPAEKAPYSDGLARAVVAFADALAKGDSAKFGEKLAPTASPFLSALESDGRWEESTKKIETVRVVYAEETPPAPDSTIAALYLAVQDPAGAYIMGFAGMKVGDQWVFTGTWATDAVKRRASEWDSASVAELAAVTQGDAKALADALAATPIPDGATPPAAPPATGDGGAGAPPAPAAPPANPRRPGVPSAPPASDPGGG